MNKLARRFLIAAFGLMLLCGSLPMGAFAFECPERTVAVGTPPPEGDELYCVQASTGELKIKHGAYRKWYPSGQKHTEGSFVMGERDGVWLNYYNTGQISRREVYHRGIKHGKFEMWHQNGNKRSEENWVRGIRQGIRQTWSQQGNPLMKENFVDGKRVGPAQFWNKNGRLKSSGFFDRQSKRDGVWTFFDQTGQRTSEGRYKAGKKDGRWRIWNSDGTIRAVEFYQNGKKTKSSKGKGAAGAVPGIGGGRKVFTTIPETKYGERNYEPLPSDYQSRRYEEEAESSGKRRKGPDTDDDVASDQKSDKQSTTQRESELEPAYTERRSYQELLREWQQEKGLIPADGPQAPPVESAPAESSHDQSSVDEDPSDDYTADAGDEEQD